MTYDNTEMFLNESGCVFFVISSGVRFLMFLMLNLLSLLMID